MKKLLVMAALAMVSFASAQKGTILVAGNIGFASEKESFDNNVENSGNFFQFAPKVGYQFHENWTAGIAGSIGSQKSESTTFNGFINVDNETKITAFSAGAFLRYTRPLSETFSVFADLDAGYQSQKRTTESNAPFSATTTSKGNGVYVGVTPALFINFKKNFGLNFSIGGLGYETMNFDNNGGDNNRFAFTFGQAFNIGISKNF